MAVQGLDRDVAPAPATAKQMLEKIGGRWWNVYIGGPESGGHGWTPALVKEYVRHGIDRFMLTYVGRQSRGPLTEAQGRADGLEALRIAKSFGYSGSFPLCLDVELSTYESAPSKAVEYARAWCATVHGAGARPGVYANPGPLKAMAEKVPADFVWVASWVSHGAEKHDPHQVPQLPRELWSRPGARAWQYAGAYGNQPCQVLGLNVDINVADLGCLAKPPGHQQGQPQRGGSRLVRRGDRGKPVERITRRLSYVRSETTGAAYLDSPRRRFDVGAETALMTFQREHRLPPDGVYGPDTARALSRAVQAQRRRSSNGSRGSNGSNGSGGTTHRAAKRPETLRTLIEDVRRLDAQTDRAWQRLVAYGERRQQQLERAGGSDPGLSEIAAILRRMEHTLETLVAVEQRELAVEDKAAEPESEAPPATAPAAERPKRGLVLDDLSDEEIQERVERLARALDRSRVVLMRRFIEVEKKVGPASPRQRERPTPKPDRPKRPKRQRPGPPPAKHIRDLQTALNRFTEKYLEGIGSLIVDGKKGPATNKRIRRVKYYLGYTGSDQKSAAADPDFLRRVEHPRSARALGPAMLARGISRRRKQNKAAKAAAAPAAGVGSFDGKPVAAWMVPYLEWARAHGWQGSLTSGYRTPEYSEHLCMGICGAVRCPGRCAGRTSNHVGRVKPQGSIDVSDYIRFGELMKQCPHSPRIFNNLPSDRVHFSSTGG
jgi:peptidoglycan hydrolase-like protein with peptidoglycan-binding domain